MKHTIRYYFITGLLAILPVFITLYLLFVVGKFIDGVWGAAINFYLKKHFGFAIPGLGLIFGIITIFAAGVIANNLFIRRFFHALEAHFLRLPLIRQVYPSAKQVVGSFISKDKPAFKKVALVQYPSKGLWSIGFLTNDSFSEAQQKTGKELVHIFIATTPSPFTGFLVLVPKEDVTFLDISVEDGVKLIVSGGIVKP